MTDRQRFIDTLHCKPVDRPPVWLMRQAGRHLPEYRELRKKHSFHELVKTPDLACEVTMQPVRRYGMDAAIIFSDILVIPEALGQEYMFRDTGGIQMAYRVESTHEVDALNVDAVPEHLTYVTDALKNVREECGTDKAVIGFGGSPWTLATYMVEGGSSKEYQLAKKLFYEDRALYDALLEKITQASITYFAMQIEAGVDVVQIFDSWGGVLAPNAFWDASGKWMKKIVDSVEGKVPTIVFSKGAHEHHELLVKTGANVLGATWTANLRAFRDQLPDDVGVQGNIDPVLITTNADLVREETATLLESMRGTTGHILNLGHGISPRAKIECVEAMVQTAQNFA